MLVAPIMMAAVLWCLFLVIFVGGLILQGMEWVMTCPWCRRVLRKKSATEPWICQNCGWSR